MFFSMWELEDIHFHNSSSLLWDWFSRHVIAFFEANVLSPYFMRYFDINNTLLITKFQDKADYAF